MAGARFARTEAKLARHFAAMEMMAKAEYCPCCMGLGRIARGICRDNYHFAMTVMDTLRDVLAWSTDCRRLNLVPWERDDARLPGDALRLVRLARQVCQEGRLEAVRATLPANLRAEWAPLPNV